MRARLLAGSLLCLLPTLIGAQAAASSRPTLGFALTAAFELGGDDFLKVAFTNGSTQKLRAGQGGTLSIGGLLRPSVTSPLSLRGTVGFKYVTTAADDANIMFTRVPLELVGSYQMPNGVRAGAGVVYHANNRFRGDGFLPNESFSSSPGVTAEVGYKVLAVTYARVSYTPTGGRAIDGSSVGVKLVWTPTRKQR
jgi:hypothetical protein